ncbi:hypothetical protein J2744_002559 [Halorubrum trapanicum]|uniref:Uncharacterized protein n=1 Tax=Halorubrum trapanicum TaxID=29284 RepID=A0A8J7RWF0_9EURY|nr:hypothetical protein [Halorubrum trapanicum]MBP1902857.1 hypothetical protein [Halorubrum trapanicum]
MANPGEFTDISFAVTSDKGKLGTRAALLIKSIRNHYPKAKIYNFIPELSYPDLNNDLKSFFESSSTVIVDEIPMPEYPLTALHRAFIEAANASDSRYIAALDTDTILLSKLQKPDTNGDPELFLKPEDSGEDYWGSSHSKDDWRGVYNHFGVEPPKMPSNLYSSVDNRQLIAPYYQGAVIITQNRNFPSRWLEMTREAVDEEIYDHDESWFHEQIVLGVLSTQYDVGLLSNEQNYPLYARLNCPSDVQLVHYVRDGTLSRFKDSPQFKAVTQFREFDEVATPATLSDYYRIFYDNISRFIPYPYHQKINIPISWARTTLEFIRS